jgi:hypothetical protein
MDATMKSTEAMLPAVMRRGAWRVATLAVASVAVVLLAPAAPASAAATGYVRLAHLSPDTPQVDVYLHSLTGAVPDQRFDAVGYGVVSGYLNLPVGTYSISMRPAGAPASTPPVLTTNVTVSAGGAYTVAGVGRYADLGLRVIIDDLSLPPAHQAKMRIIQASVRAPILDVAVNGGAMIAAGIPFATTTGYLLIDPGPMALKVAASGGATSAVFPVNLDDGNVYSLLVLDALGSGLTTQLLADAQRRGGVPQGGVETGAGPVSRLSPMLFLLAAAIALAATAALMWLRRRRAVW